MKAKEKVRVVVVYNRDFERTESDPENKAREDIAVTAGHVVEILGAGGAVGIKLGVTEDVLAAVRAIEEFAPHVVFNLCESIRGNNRFEPLLPMLLELEEIAFTGSSSFALALALRKDKAKEILRARGIPTPAAVLLETPDASAVDLRFPLIVKPSREDASVGICNSSVVSDRAALEARVRHVLAHYEQPALVEQYVEGREIYVSLLGRPDGRPQVFPFFEIDFSGMPEGLPHIVSFEGKWVEQSPEYHGTLPVRCSGLSPALEASITGTALAAFDAIGLRDYARVDIRLDAAETPYVIDVNPNCDLSALSGGYSRAAKAAGLCYKDVVMRIVDLALARRTCVAALPLALQSTAAIV